MMETVELYWSPAPSGGWWLYDKPPGESRLPIGDAHRYGGSYRGILTSAWEYPESGEVTAGSLAAAKKQLEDLARRVILSPETLRVERQINGRWRATLGHPATTEFCTGYAATRVEAARNARCARATGELTVSTWEPAA